VKCRISKFLKKARSCQHDARHNEISIDKPDNNLTIL